MQRHLLYIAILFMMAAPAAARAQGDDERDPFYPSARRPAPQAQQQPEADWGRDPFDRPFSGPTAGTSRAPQHGPSSGGLTGIIYSTNVRLAIIGGEVLREGGTVGDRRIVDIRKKSVVLMTAAGGREEMFLEDFSLGR